MLKKKKSATADEISEMATRGEDVSRFFTNKGRMVEGMRRNEAIQRVTVDFTQQILADLDAEAKRLNISRQAVIKTLVSDGLASALAREVPCSFLNFKIQSFF